jgi:DNA helicase-2/ATP-dependent DNA helicase PcrA
MMHPELILGPPGTGKTTTLLRFVEEELARGTPPEEIGYLSFTKRAATEAVERACEKFNLSRGQFRYFRTLHSLCFQQLGMTQGDVLQGKRLREFGEHVGVRVSEYRSMDDTQMFGFEEGDRILFMENLARVRGVSLRQQYEENSDNLSWNKVDYVSRSLRQYKDSTFLLDYTDMLERFVQEGHSPRLQVLVIDEAQDLSMLQWRVVEKLAQGARRVIVAGDDDQAIYRWAGAAVEHFVQMRGEVQVLGRSWRVPPQIQAVGQEVISAVRNRREKRWSPHDTVGRVERPMRFEDVDMSGDDVLVLARNVYALREQVMPLLESDGVVYEFRGQSSVRDGAIQAILSWERLRRGERVGIPDVRKIYDMLSTGTGVRRGFKRLPNFSDEDQVSMADLRESGGLVTDAIWHEAFERMADRDRVYILRARQKGERLSKKPRVRLSTIHGSKGGEADHVVLLTDMAKRTHEEAEQNPEDEARVWYVATTRARQTLSVVAPRGGRGYPV